jgi:hypothetical protein
VTKTADDGTTGTLRWAITQANDNRGPDTINFSIPTSDPNYESRNGWWRITINNTLGALPTLTDNGTTIDGHSPGNENVTGLEILIDGSNLGGTMSILTIESDYNNIQGLALANAPGAGINIVTNAFNNTITDSYIGTDPNGALDWGNATGIKISSGANHNTIDQCVISGNDEDGVLITGSNTDDNIVRRSIIGLNAAGTDKIPNNWDGVAIANGAQGIVIGGNNHLPAPTITAADCTKVEGSLSFVCPYCKVEIYSDGLNQGKYYEGTATMQIFLPSWSWSGTVRGPNVTATVTDHRDADTSDYQNTSEFSLPWIGACYSNYLPVTYKNH